MRFTERLLKKEQIVRYTQYFPDLIFSDDELNQLDSLVDDKFWLMRFILVVMEEVGTTFKRLVDINNTRGTPYLISELLKDLEWHSPVASEIVRICSIKDLALTDINIRPVLSHLSKRVNFDSTIPLNLASSEKINFTMSDVLKQLNHYGLLVLGANGETHINPEILTAQALIWKDQKNNPTYLYYLQIIEKHVEFGNRRSTNNASNDIETGFSSQCCLRV